jgi:hypothetical protein
MANQWHSTDASEGNPTAGLVLLGPQGGLYEDIYGLVFFGFFLGCGCSEEEQFPVGLRMMPRG